MNSEVLLCNALEKNELQDLLSPYRITVNFVAIDAPLPGSYWGDPEAGLIGEQLYIRPTTPVQSALHEACHYICMDETRRRVLDTDAGGGYDEENSVCYLQILLAKQLTSMGAARMMQDMDQWGYTFRLGSAKKWFEEDAQDARNWLIEHQLLDKSGQPSGYLRDQALKSA